MSKETTPYNPLDHIKTSEQLEAYVQERMRAGRRVYGYGVVDKDGELYIDHDGYAVAGICENYASSMCDCLNAGHEILGVDDDGKIKHDGFESPAPYRVVRLEWSQSDE